MAGASFSPPGSPTMVAGMPKPPKPGLPAKPKGTGASLSFGTGATLSGLHPGTPPQKPPTTVPPKASGTTTAPPASPLDSTYYQNIAANQFKVNNQINSLTAQGQNANTSLQSALAQLAYQQPRDQLKAEQAMNARGGLYSSVEGQNQGNIVNQYQTRQSGLTQANAQKQAAISSEIKGLQEGEPIYDAGQYDAAVARAVKAALANPATGQAPISTPAPPSVAPPPAKAKVPANYKIGQGVPKAKSGFGYRGGF